jgi:4-diphosphocytidyl-2-C-methyl-D-erythritol kinase
MTIKAFAKLNLSLNILQKRLENGLFEVKFINTQINLADKIEIKKSNKIEIISSKLNFPLNEKNLVYQVAQKLGVTPLIKITKNIPIVGGLGGGSSDAAYTLNELIKLYNLEITPVQLLSIANQIGKDVCYLIKGGLCQVLNDGNLVQSIPYRLPKLYLILIYPKQQKPSTTFMYKNLNPNQIGKNLNHFNQLKKGIKEKNKINIIKNLFNDFEILAEKICPEISKIKFDLKDNKAHNTLLLGSGFGIAGFFINKNQRDLSFIHLKDNYKTIFKSETI